MMGPGFWLNPAADKAIEVTDHGKWISDQDNATKIGLSGLAFSKIKNGEDARMVAVVDGLIRIREYPDRVSVYFFTDQSEVRKILWSVNLFLRQQLSGLGEKAIHLNNLKYNDSASTTLAALDKALRDDAPIMMKEAKYSPPEMTVDKDLLKRLDEELGK